MERKMNSWLAQEMKGDMPFVVKEKQQEKSLRSVIKLLRALLRGFVWENAYKSSYYL